MNIPKLSNSNYDEMLKEASCASEDLLKEIFKDIISFMPYKNEIMSDFILDLKNTDCNGDCNNLPVSNPSSNTPISNNPNFTNILFSLLNDLIHSNDLFILISSVVYSKRLGFNLNFSEFKISPIENKINFSDSSLEMNEVDKIKILEFLERIKEFIFEYEQVQFGDEEFFIYFFCISILKNFKFSIKECVNELRSTAEDQIIISSIIIYSNITKDEDIVFLTSILLKIINLENYEMVLKGFPFMNKNFRDFLITMIHENYLIKNYHKSNEHKNYNEHLKNDQHKSNLNDHHHKSDRNFPFSKDQDLNKIKEFVDDLTLDVLSKFCNLENLIQFLPEFKEKIEIPLIKPIPKEKFVIHKDREKFFKDFCLLGSPSVSHFLSYLEIYKKEFKLSEEDQRLFLEVFSRIFIKRKSFTGIILGKMVKFGIIKRELI
ncbi:hypothetical protein NBO_59g0008 [Nosema bombycis CQ1]|uniref:Uncharacterized protein n=1 Tax=Nosema bombycis (strain CQ1 / CVCC 102059) TaxID=578461 RepID=R0KSP6_NOSB1|nr:hypothetical protein NBO_59g0008 [Nosema bombycis CQ1]|eukprot:EOB13786.1 hypothetical protein NBO_59g0008 [Nosema bombycis CQ1]